MKAAQAGCFCQAHKASVKNHVPWVAMVKHATEHPGTLADANGHLGESRESTILVMNLHVAFIKQPEG